MIVPMKKVTIIVQSKDSDPAIRALGTLGVMHVEYRTPPKGKDIVSLEDDMGLIDKVIDILSQTEFCGKSGMRDAKLVKDWKFAANHIIDLDTRLNHLREYSRNMRNIIGQWEAWGDFDPQDIAALEAKGIFLKLYQIPSKELKKLYAEDRIVKVISSKAGLVNCAVISRKKISVPFKEVTPPKMRLKEMRARLSEDEGVMHAITEGIRKYTCYRARFLLIKEAFERELKFHQAVRGMGQAGKLAYLVGYVPQDAVDKVSWAAGRQRWGMLVEDPGAEDMVPTFIRNPKWISIIKPVFRMIDIVPGYKELDISFWFLFFFSIFFGMLIGDAGYGLIYLFITFFAQKKWGTRTRDKSIFFLFYLLSSCAVIWGALTGTFFGQEWFSKFARPLVPALQKSKNVQTLCFFLGALQLSIGHIWRSIRKFPSIMALADLGWALILWGGFFLAKFLILGTDFPDFAKWFFIVGPVMVVVFTSPSRNIAKGIGSGLGSLLLNFVNSFTDIVSYIRLFAVGLATVAIADAFNKMAMSVGFNNVLSGLAASFVLIIGHLLNIILGPLAVLVHGVRLNVLEFCNHLDIKWL
ncbi:MAG: hypothetical protein PHP46_06475, partial [Candidatus Omnitrophica bacterium]|nr:hypothetical protein [Candidatus Omnitrophota bacterium]